MKKILLSMMLIGALSSVKAQQIVLNEIYPDPSIPPNEEYIELFNTSGNIVDISGYSLVTYTPGSPSIVWVYTVPEGTFIDPFGFVVFASNEPIEHQGGSYGPADNAISWNSEGCLSKYTITNNNLVSESFSGDVTDLIPITGGNSTTLNIMLFDADGSLVSGFFANNSHTIPAAVTNLGEETFNTSCGSETLHFEQVVAGTAEFFDLNQAPGNDNGYRRKNNGFCGSWEKAEPANTYSPGESNGTIAIDPATFAIAALPRCYEDINGAENAEVSTWTVSIAISQADLLPAHYIIYEDTDFSGGESPNAGDAIVAEGDILDANAIQEIFETKSWVDIYIVINTNSNCIEELRHIGTQCAALPITLKSFNAVRSGSDVNLAWQTAVEAQNKGFEIQRFIGSAGGWETIGFVGSQALHGNSSEVLNYVFTDLNNTVRGITQYRLKQVDIDGKGTYSFIRSVRGQGQLVKTIIYPNPSGDGKVNIVFENVNSSRDVSLMDISGKTLKQWKGVTNNNIQIDNLNAGFYSVRIVNNETGEHTVEKFIVNKR